MPSNSGSGAASSPAPGAPFVVPVVYAGSPTPSPTYTYRALTADQLDVEATLNEMGRGGWLLVAVAPTSGRLMCFFVRTEG